ncbi:MAG: ATP-binding protein [Desulfobacterium sp.]|jgi:serine/threonine-protein kinase RsbW|nr:ATP-binding protein [Desulfobacterium sp.]
MSQIFNRTIRPNTLSITFSSTLENIDRICDEVSRFLDRNLKCTEAHLFSINLVIREALTNAVRHGNNLDPEKKVKFFLKIERKKRLRIIVEDQGEGFDWQKARESPPGANDDHGRGLAIMTTYFSSYCYNRKGNRLVLKKKLNPNH